MKRCLVLNPNTTAAVTEMVVAACRRAQPGLQWEGASARFGAPYIADEASYAKATPAVLDAFEAFHAGHDDTIGHRAAALQHTHHGVRMLLVRITLVAQAVRAVKFIAEFQARALRHFGADHRLQRFFQRLPCANFAP